MSLLVGLVESFGRALRRATRLCDVTPLLIGLLAGLWIFVFDALDPAGFVPSTDELAAAVLGLALAASAVAYFTLRRLGSLETQSWRAVLALGLLITVLLGVLVHLSGRADLAPLFGFLAGVVVGHVACRICGRTEKYFAR